MVSFEFVVDGQHFVVYWCYVGDLYFVAEPFVVVAAVVQLELFDVEPKTIIHI